MKCIFCDIIEKKSKAEILFEDNEVVAFMDINPLNYGHSLVVPKIHCDDFLSLPENNLNQLIKIIQHIADCTMKAFKYDGFNIVSNNGRAAGQSIYHCHFHIIPRFFEDGHRFRMNLKKYNNGEMKIYADKIRAKINSVEFQLSKKGINSND